MRFYRRALITCQLGVVDHDRLARSGVESEGQQRARQPRAGIERRLPRVENDAAGAGCDRLGEEMLEQLDWQVFLLLPSFVASGRYRPWPTARKD